MKYLFWLDMEMSGLNPMTDRILEVALIVTDYQFQVLETYEAIVFQKKELLDGMDEWCTKHHGQSGLTAKVAEGKPEELVENELCKIFQKYSSSKEKAVLAGNSIGQDRKFIEKWMPELEQLLHYRMLDVSSYKIIFNEIYQKNFKKQEKHRALDDILESIEELKFYLSFVQLK